MATPILGQTPSAAPAARRWRGLRWALPAAAVFLLAMATLFLLALSSTQERGEVRERLVSETLWVRESVLFQLGRETEALELMASDIARGRFAVPAVQARLNVYLRRAREVAEVAVVDASLNLLAHVEREGTSGDMLGAMPAALADSAMAKARETGKPAFTAPFDTTAGSTIALFAPVPEGDHWLAALYPLDRVLEEMVPWDFAQQHEVTLSDIGGAVRARRVSTGRGRGVYTDQEPLDLSGTTLLLGANSVKGPPGWTANVVRVGIVALAAVLLFSLWALWRDHRRRIDAEHRLREEAAFRRAMGDSAVIGLRARDMRGRVLYVNPAFCRMVGYSEEDLVGNEPPMPYWIPERIDEYRKRHDDVISGRASEAPFETVMRRRNGETFPAVIYDAPLRDADGNQVGWMSSILDVTEEKRAEERERQREERLQTAARLTTMGEMASSLAHELNQPLGAIASYLAGSKNLLESGQARGEELREAIGKAAAQAQRAGQVIRRVHEFVRKQEPQRVPLDIAVLVEDCRPLIALQCRREAVQVDIESDADLPRIEGDPVMLQQVILNLTRNAVEAMARTPPRRRRIVLAARRDEGGVRVSVRDFGEGIPDTVADRLFSPFFTTKPEGMGMGLSICRSIAEAHGGRLWFERLDEGVVFHLQLPAAA